MRRLGTIALVSILAGGGILPAEEEEEEKEEGKGTGSVDVAVMSFNIRFGTADDGENSWPNRSELAARVIRERQPDVVGLQEALRSQIDELRRALPGYGEVGAGRDDGKSGGEHCTILYRADRLRVEATDTFWLSETPDVPGSKHWGNEVTRIVTWSRFVEKDSGIGFYVYNAHLDHQSQEARARSVELLARAIRERRRDDAYIVLGDFNAGEDNPAVRYLRGELPRASSGEDAVVAAPPLADAFRTLHPDAVDVGTFHGFRGGASGRMIDYVLAAPWVEVSRAEIVREHADGRYPSDHYPVFARLRVPAVRKS